MSYEIIYGKQFIFLKSTGEIVAMILTGSNNCYEIAPNGGNGRRARSWTSMNYYNNGPSLSAKPEAILANLDKELAEMIEKHKSGDHPEEDTPENIKARFGYYSSLSIAGSHTTGTSWEMWKNVFKNGIKNAMTIEALDSVGVNPWFCHYPRENDGAPGYQSLRTEAEYFIELEKWLTWRGDGKNRTFSLSYSPTDTDRVLTKLRAAVPPKEPVPKVTIRQDHFFVLSNSQGNLVRYTSRGYKYSPYEHSAKSFRTSQEAEAYRADLIKRGKHQAETWKIERVSGTFNYEVPASSVKPQKQEAIF
jgi:hypothetical protein